MEKEEALCGIDRRPACKNPEPYIYKCQLLIDIALEKKINLTSDLDLIEELIEEGLVQLENKNGIGICKVTKTGQHTAVILKQIFDWVDRIKEEQNSKI